VAGLDRQFMMRPARRILEQCLNVQPGEELLVLTDTTTGAIGEIFALVGHEMGAEVTMLSMAPRGRHGEEPPAIVAAAMAASAAIVAPTSFSVNHTEARSRASAAGARLIFMPDAVDEIFRNGSLDIDFEAQSRVIGRVADVLERGSHVTVRSPLGTRLDMEIGGRRPVPQTGICHAPGTISPPPCIEVAVAPLEETTHGVMYVDAAVVPGGPCREPIKLTFEAGRIEAIEGGEDADRLRATLASYDDPNIYCAVEMGMGMNPNARVGASSSLEDEAELGTMHIGIGNGITFGSSIRAKGHCDLVMRDAIVEVDGQAVLEDRRVMV
jgi:leucyl aminopeptidase (aminopeptidase T)